MKIRLLIFAIGIVILCGSPARAQLFEQLLAREALQQAWTKARAELNADALLEAVAFAAVSQGTVTLQMDQKTGKATGWVYVFHSQTLDSTIAYVAVKIPIIGFQVLSVPIGSLPTPPTGAQFGTLQDPWIDSNVSTQSAMNAGGAAFFAQYSDAKIAIAIVYHNPFAIPQPPIPAGPVWVFRFESSTDALGCFINGTTGVSILCASIPTSAKDAPDVKAFALDGNYPNPVAASSQQMTNIRFTVAERGANEFVSLKLFDALGREVRTLVNEQLDPGMYSITVNASALAAGTYYYTLSTTSQTETKRLVVTK